MKPYHLIKPPRAIRKARLDNLALVPASLLPFKERWQEAANSKAGEHVLIVLPTLGTRPRNVMERVAALIREKGYAVTILPAEQFSTRSYPGEAAMRSCVSKPDSDSAGM